MDIAALGIAMDTSGLKQGEGAFDSATKSANRAADAFDRVGDQATQSGKKVAASAAQTANAMRMLPAQMTDIAVGLSTGQSPFTVLLQQGGQLKDMFGGIGPAIQATATYVSGLINPLTLTAAAAAALAYGIYSGNKEAKEFNNTLALTGNYVGQTASSFQALTRQVAGDTKSAFGDARDVLMDLAKTGRYTSGELDDLGALILRTSRLTGESLEDVSKDYAKLAQDPAKWAAEHNQAMHFMDVATYQHIKALQEAGDKHAAVQAVIDAATAQVAASSVDHLSKAEKAWRSLSGSVSQFWEEVKKGLSTGPTLQDRIDTLMGERGDIQSNPLAAGRVSQIDQQVALLQEQQRLEQRAAETSAANAQRQEQAIAAQQRVDKLADTVMSNAQRRQKELEKLQKDREDILAGGGKFSEDDYAKLVAGINDKYKDPKNTAAASAQQNSLAGQLAELEGFAKRARNVERSSQLDLQQERTQGLISERDYLQQSTILKEKALQDQLDIAKQQEQIAAGRNSLAERERYAAKVQDLEDQIVNTRKEGANAVVAYDKKATDSLRAYTDALDNALKLRQQEIGQNVQALGLGDTARDQLVRIQQANRDFDQKFYDLSRSRREGRISEDDYQTQLAALQKYQTDRVLLEQSATQQMLAAQSSWELGATRALANYVDTAQNVFSQTEGLVTRAFGSMEDALVSFTMTGKLNFSDFAKSVISDLIRIQTRAALSGIFSQLGSMVLGAIGGAGSSDALYGGVQGSTDYAGTPVDMSNPVGTPLARAGGGDVDAGTPLMVGERGRPELFVPDVPGRILPDTALKPGAPQQAAPSIEFHNTWNIDSRTDRQEIMSMIQLSQQQTKSQILDSMNRGGAFSPKR